jgi:hypothetical protein
MLLDVVQELQIDGTKVANARPLARSTARRRSVNRLPPVTAPSR